MQKARIWAKYPKDYCEFEAGDKIKITKLIALSSKKAEILRGFVLETRGAYRSESIISVCVKAVCLFVSACVCVCVVAALSRTTWCVCLFCGGPLAGSNTLMASFVIMNKKLGETFEMQLPMNSPFIIKIEMIEKGEGFVKRNKLRYMRDRPANEWVC